MSQPSTERPNGTERIPALSERDRRRLLRSPRRQLLVPLLGSRSPPIELREIATAIGEREHATGDPTAAAVERIAVALHHTHLPVMEEMGLLTYDAASRTIGTLAFE